MAEITRNIDTVTAEIVMIRENVKKTFFEGVVQIGTRLEEAKSLVPQGEWLHYLETCLGYKPSTAQNYMRIAREFGNGQIALDGKSAGDLFGGLGYTQLLPLIGISPEERAELAEGNDLPNMSSREIQKLVDDHKKAVAAKELAERRAMDANNAREKAEKKAEQAEQAEADAVAAAKAAEAREQELQGRVDKLLEEAKQEPIEATCTVGPSDEEMAALRAEVETEYAEKMRMLEASLHRAKNGAAQRASIYFHQLLNTWTDLLAAVEALLAEEPETGEKFKNAIRDSVSEFPEAIDEMEGNLDVGA